MQKYSSTCKHPFVAPRVTWEVKTERLVMLPPAPLIAGDTAVERLGDNPGISQGGASGGGIGGGWPGLSNGDMASVGVGEGVGDTIASLVVERVVANA